MFCHEISETLGVSTDVENNLLFLLSFHNVLWGNFLGPFTTWDKSFQTTEKNNKNYDREQKQRLMQKTIYKCGNPPSSLPVYFSSSTIVIKNKDLFTTNNEFHNLCTGQQHNFHQPSVNLKKYQTAVYCMGIKIFKQSSCIYKKGVY